MEQPQKAQNGPLFWDTLQGWVPGAFAFLDLESGSSWDQVELNNTSSTNKTFATIVQKS